jgi:hypothetical protein
MRYIIIAIFFICSATGVSAASPAVKKNIVLSVPFTSQAPLFEWKDERQQDGCEEASALMALVWAKGGQGYTKKVWRDKIVGLSDWENKKYGEYRDVALTDMVDWIFRDYFDYSGAQIKTVKSAADIRSELEKGNLVLAPMNGQALKNPNFTSPGPERHMILIKGYDYKAKQFITNDPGTRKGENYRYSEKTIFNAIRAYKTGYKLPFGPLRKEVIVVSKLPAAPVQK